MHCKRHNAHSERPRISEEQTKPVSNFIDFPAGNMRQQEQHRSKVSQYNRCTDSNMENWRLLIIITVFLILIAYTVPITQMFTENIPGAKGFKLW